MSDRDRPGQARVMGNKPSGPTTGSTPSVSERRATKAGKRSTISSRGGTAEISNPVISRVLPHKPYINMGIEEGDENSGIMCLCCDRYMHGGYVCPLEILGRDIVNYDLT